MLEEEKVTAPETTAAPENQAAPSDANKDNKNNGHRPDRRPHGERRGHGDHRGENKSPYDKNVVFVNRVSKTVKGGRRMKFTALVVVGDKKGQYGFALSKAAEVPDAIKKAEDAAKKKLYKIHIVKGGTIAHPIIGKFGACSVLLKPAPEGTGIIAGGPVRAILELAGVKNICSKVYGSRAPINIIRATHQGLSNLKSYKETLALRGKEAK